MSGQWLQKPPLGTQIDWNNPLTKGLVECYLLNEGSGEKTFDMVAGRSNNAWPSAASWKPSKNGSALYFDETGFITYPINIIGGVLLSKYFTIIIEYYALDAPDDVSLVLLFEGTDDLRIYGNRLTGGTGIGIHARDTLGYVAEATGSTQNKWTQFIITFAPGEQKWYRNGVLVRQDTNSLSGLGPFETRIQLGGLQAGYYFKGYVNYWAVYSRALTQSEAVSLYINPYQICQPPLPYWMRPSAVEGQPYIKRLGGVPYAAINKGVW